MGHARKEVLAGGLVAKGGPRDAAQVLANGGAFAVCALASLSRPPAVPRWYAAGAGGLAAATADTWGTEVGMLSTDTRSIVSGRVVPPGYVRRDHRRRYAGVGRGRLFIAIGARAIGWPAAAAGAH